MLRTECSAASPDSLRLRLFEEGVPLVIFRSSPPDTASIPKKPRRRVSNVFLLPGGSVALRSDWNRP